MKALFEKTPEQIRELRKNLQNYDILRVLAWRPNNTDPCYYFKNDTADTLFECNLDEKIRMEISRWSNALSSCTLTERRENRQLHDLSPALHSIYMTQTQTEVKNLFARTIRMLLFLESVLLGKECPANNPYCEIAKSLNLHNYFELFKSLTDCLKEISQKTGTVTYNSEGTWVVSLPLLLIVAVGESHCEYIQPFAWEAYSAARARDELRRRWTGIDESALNKILNTVALFVRCQTAVGQRQRESGTPAFISLVNNNLDKLAFDENSLFYSLKLLAVIGEARNHKVPKNESSDGFDIDAECNKDWTDEVPTKIEKYLEFEQQSSSNSSKEKNENFTWSYFRPSYLGLTDTKDNCQDVEAFKETIRRKKIFLIYINLYKIDIISIGRAQTQQPLRELIGEVITGWSKLFQRDKTKLFEQFFRLEPLPVPHPFPGEKEYTLCVLLRDDLAAEQLLFPSVNNIKDLKNKYEKCPRSAIERASDLFSHLIKVAREKLKLDEDAMWDEKEALEPVYVPFPLIRRITEIIYRLQPSTCFSIPISIDRSTTDWIRLPYGISKNHHLHKRVLANFLLATVLNRGMASGLSRAEIDLENLAIPSQRSETQESVVDKENSEDFMQPEDWRKAVQELYVQGGYNVLLDRYLRDFNSQRKNVYFETRLSPDTQFGSNRMDALAVGEIRNDLKQYLIREKVSEKYTAVNKFWLLGVDIGGTLTKCQLFYYNSDLNNISQSI
ncbi:hypothetical protein [Geobacter sp.]|uniref:hypothetical protein n=1 Tax=Geobacter sp. TaxID=46610 RepID=UPI0027B8C27A|nr:hypothetical protein [Geobacter sp.]